MTKQREYRIKQDKPHRYVVQLATVVGWLDIDSTSTKGAALDIIRQKVADEQHKTAYFDMAGNQISSN